MEDSGKHRINNVQHESKLRLLKPLTFLCISISRTLSVLLAICLKRWIGPGYLNISFKKDFLRRIQCTSELFFDSKQVATNNFRRQCIFDGKQLTTNHLLPACVSTGVCYLYGVNTMIAGSLVRVEAAPSASKQLSLTWVFSSVALLDHTLGERYIFCWFLYCHIFDDNRMLTANELDCKNHTLPNHLSALTNANPLFHNKRKIDESYTSTGHNFRHHKQTHGKKLYSAIYVRRQETKSTANHRLPEHLGVLTVSHGLTGNDLRRPATDFGRSRLFSKAIYSLLELLGVLFAFSPLRRKRPDSVHAA